MDNLDKMVMARYPKTELEETCVQERNRLFNVRLIYKQKLEDDERANTELRERTLQPKGTL